LIQVKALRAAGVSIGRQPRGTAMPIETVFIVAGIVVVFSLFAAALAWADIYTHRGAEPLPPAE